MGRVKFTSRSPQPTPSAPPPSSPSSEPRASLASPSRWSIGFLYSRNSSSFAEGASPLDPDHTPNIDEDDDDMSPKHNLVAALRTAMSRRKPLEKILLASAEREGGSLSAHLLGDEIERNSSGSPSGEDAGMLTFMDLLAIGIGGTIGSGVFVLTGDVQPVAGPSAVLSWVIAGLTCLLSAFSYMELSARIPTRGSCYIFCYATLGELAAVIGGVCLTLEYGISGAGIARSWSEKFAALIKANLEIQYGSTSDGKPHNCIEKRRPMTIRAVHYSSLCSSLTCTVTSD